jgi:hypothetical protein
MKIGTPPSAPTTISSTSRMFSMRPRPRTTDQLPLASTTLPPTFRLLRRTASTTAESGIL